MAESHGARAHGKPAVPLGRLMVYRGSLEAVRPRFERLARQAFFTRKLSVLQSDCLAQRASGDAFATRFQHQRAAYELQAVSVAALGDQVFADVVKSLQIGCLSRNRGLDADNVIAVLPSAELVACVDGPTFEHLGVEEPASGAKDLHKKLLTVGRRHVRLELGVSKTRRKRAAPLEAVSRWRSLVSAEDRCALDAYCDREPPQGYGFAPLVAFGATVRRLEVPVVVRRFQLAGDVVPGASGDGASVTRPPLEDLAHRPEKWNESSYNDACEDLIDWIGAVHLGIDAPFDGGGTESGAREPPKEEAALLWVMGESLIGPAQIFHTLKCCVEDLAAGCGWFLLSVWGAEDAPVSHHGGAHGFDVTGAHHMHLLVVRGRNGQNDARCLLLEYANALHSVSAA